MTDTTVTLQGTVKKRTETDVGIIQFETCEVTLEESFTDAKEFDSFIRTSPDSMAESALPEGFFVVNSRVQAFDATVSLNAVEAQKWAETVADDDETRTAVDVLTRWLQIFGSMRIRRALHSMLREQGVSVQEVD